MDQCNEAYAALQYLTILSKVRPITINLSLNNFKFYGFSAPNIQSPITEPTQTSDLASPNLVKQQSPFYAEPADSLSSLQQAIPKRIAYRPAPGIPLHHRHSNPPGLNSLKALSPGLDRVEDGVELQGGKLYDL